MVERTKVYVDVETTGFQDYKHTRVIELAWMAGDMTKPEVIYPYAYDGEYGMSMKPKNNVWVKADPEAMEVNKFYERYPNGIAASSQADIERFLAVARRATLVGANVRFDAEMIMRTLLPK